MILLLIFLLNPNINSKLDERGFLNLWIGSDNLSRTANILEKYGFRTRAVSKWENYISGYFPKTLKNRKKILPLIKNVKPVLSGKRFESIRPFSFTPSDYGESYEVLKFLNLIEVHRKGFIGQNVRISIFDTGFDLSHPALMHIREGERVKFTYDFNSGDSLFLIFNNNTYRVPHKRAIGYIGSPSITGNNDTLYIFYSFLNERDNLTNLWKIYGTLFLNGSFFPQNEPKLITPDTTSLLPSALYYQGKIYLVNKIITGNTEGILLTFLDKLLNVDSSKVLIQGSPIFDIEILNFRNSIYIVYSDTGSLNIIDLNGNTILSINKTILDFKTGVKNDTLFISYETGISESWVGILALDSLFNIIKDTLLSKGFSPELKTKNDTIKLLFITGNRRDTVYEIKMNPDMQVISKKIIDNGFFIRTPVYFQNKIYYSKNGIIYSYDNGIIDSVFEYFTDNLNSYNQYMVYRRRGDRDVNIDPLTDYSDPLSGVYHGTRMLGLIGGYAPGRMIGTAPGAEFLLFKTERTNTFEGGDFEHYIEEDFWVEALELSYRFGAKIVSSSLGYSDWYTKRDMEGKTAISSRAASKALSKGILVFTAAGNVAHSDTTKPDTTIVAPGDADSVITVGGVKLDGNIWNGSAFGPTSDGRIKPDIVAPFKSTTLYMEITSSGDTLYSYSESQGTSVSTALMAGFAASVLSAHPDWGARKLYRIIRETASNSQNPDNIYGYGIPDALKVLNYERILIPSKEGEKSRIISLYPNPVKGDRIKIEYIINEALTPVSLKIFTASGKRIFERSYFTKPLGRYKEIIELKTRNGKNIPPGLYLFVLETAESKDIKKIIIEK